jgi:hypothetical protein
MNWLPIESYVFSESMSVDVRLLTEIGEVVGFFDPVACCWRATDNDRIIQPMLWKPDPSPFDRGRLFQD